MNEIPLDTPLPYTPYSVEKLKEICKQQLDGFQKIREKGFREDSNEAALCELGELNVRQMVALCDSHLELTKCFMAICGTIFTDEA